MKNIGVVFPNSTKVYLYQTKLNLIEGGVYDITVDGGHTYTSYVTVLGPVKTNYSGNIRTITAAKLIDAPKKKNNVIKNTYFNYKDKITTVVWADGTNTMVTCQDGDEFDEEKAILACFVKRFFDNRGYYNEVINDAIKNAKRLS